MVDVEAALMTFFDDMAWTTTVANYTYLPGLISEHGGVLRIKRIGGGGDRDTDRPTVSVQAYGVDTQANPRATHDLAAAVWDRFLEVLNGSRSGWVSEGVLIENPDKTSGPVEIPGPQTSPQIVIYESLFSLTFSN